MDWTESYIVQIGCKGSGEIRFGFFVVVGGLLLNRTRVRLRMVAWEFICVRRVCVSENGVI